MEQVKREYFKKIYFEVVEYFKRDWGFYDPLVSNVMFLIQAHSIKTYGKIAFNEMFLLDPDGIRIITNYNDVWDNNIKTNFELPQYIVDTMKEILPLCAEYEYDLAEVIDGLPIINATFNEIPSDHSYFSPSKEAIEMGCRYYRQIITMENMFKYFSSKPYEQTFREMFELWTEEIGRWIK